MRKLTLLPLCLLIALTCLADKDPKKKTGDKTAISDSLVAEITARLKLEDSVNKVLKYESGNISLPACNANLDIPASFKFLNAQQSRVVLEKLWGNPPDSLVLGTIWPQANTPFTDTNYVFVVSYEDMGYVKDEDAKTVDYGKMMSDWKADQPNINAERVKEGYAPQDIIGWAETPYYDDKSKVLHWAKEFKFGDDTTNTLNYEVRVLGRKGVLKLEAIARMSDLPLVNKDINTVLGMASFTAGNKYSDYNSGSDKVAEYTVGGLVAGAILTKVGFWAVLIKFAKVIVLGIIGAFYAVRKWLTGKGRKRDEAVPEVVQGDNNTTA